MRLSVGEFTILFGFLVPVIVAVIAAVILLKIFGSNKK